VGLIFVTGNVFQLTEIRPQTVKSMVTRTSRFNFCSGRDPDHPAYQWDAKHELLNLAEVCGLRSAILAVFVLF